jgi:hypothetical protein
LFEVTKQPFKQFTFDTQISATIETEDKEELSMRSLLKTFLVGSSLLLLGGCASHENFVKAYNSWVGQNIHHFTAQYGYPDTTYTLKNGNEVYVYEKTRVYSTPTITPAFGYGPWGYYGGIGMGYGTDVNYETCKLFLEVNPKGIIEHWGSRGNSCRM